jgi:NAD(P)-dependent dehydrogenase (short-subunit alcohol dehydrogenase family)
MADFVDRVCVVTGAASGLGLEVVRALRTAGACMMLIDRDADRLQAVAREHQDVGAGRIRYRAGDVSDGGAVTAAARATEDAFGKVHVLINAAGVLGPAVAVVDCEEADWDRVFDVNVKGTYLMARYFVPLIRKAGGGAIVNFASTAGIVGSATLGPYSASKGAVVLLTRSMALQHATENIRVNCVCPGSIETPMLRATFESAGDAAIQRAREETFRQRHPMLRFGRPDEVAHAVLFLASDEASYITGAALPVDGGRLA